MNKFGLRVAAVIFALFALTGTAHAQLIASNSPITTAGSDCSVSTRCVIIPDSYLRGLPSIGVYIDVGTSGTFNFEATLDGTNWFAVPDDVAGATSLTADGAKFFSNPGDRSFRVRASAISGAASVYALKGFATLRSTATLTGGGGDGALIDGVSAAIKATVLDLTNSNPLTTAIVDATGNQITSFGGGTQVTEDAAAAADPIGTMSMARRRDTLTGAEVSADGDVITVNATSKGEIYVKQTDVVPVNDNGGSLTVDGTVAISGTVAVTDNSGSLTVDNGGTFAVQPAGSVAHDGVGTSVNPVLTGGYASAAAPTDVSADGDAVRDWKLRNGATATVITAAGALIGGDATNGLDVDVTRVTGTVTVAGNKTNNNAAPGATNVGALVGIANASAPTYTEGNQVLLSTDLSGALRVSGAGGGTQYTQDAALTVGTSVGGMAMGRASAAAPTDVSADNDAVMPWYLRSGAQVNQVSFGGVLASTGNGASGTGVQRVTIANDSTGTVDTELGAATAAGSGLSNPTAPWVLSANMCFNGTTWDRCPADPANDAVDSGNPLKIGGKATSALSGATMVSSGDRVDAAFDVDGALITRPAPLGDQISGVVAVTDGSSTSLISAAGAGVKIYLTSCTVANSTASTFVTLDLRDGTAGSVKWTFPVPPSAGATHSFPYPLAFSANTAVAADPSGAASTITISCMGFKSKV